MNCIAYRDPRRELFNTLKKETNLFLDSMTPSSAFAIDYEQSLFFLWSFEQNARHANDHASD